MSDLREQIREAKHQYFTDVASGLEPNKSLQYYTDRIKTLIRNTTLDGVRPEVERLLTDETVIANCINLETLNKAIDNLRGTDDE